MRPADLLNEAQDLSAADRADSIVLAVRSDRRQRSYLLHKSDAGLVMDSRWLMAPEAAGEVHGHLRSVTPLSGAIMPIGYGIVAVDFEHRRIMSAQSYRDLSLFTAGEFGFPGYAGPRWLDWTKVLAGAFAHEAVTDAIYERSGTRRTVHSVPLATPARERQALALRFASHNRPEGFHFRGLGFRPRGWTVDVIPASKHNARWTGERAVHRLARQGWRCAALEAWATCGYG